MIFVIGVSGCAYWKDLGERHKLWELNQINQSGLVIPATCDGVYGELLKGYRVMEYDKKIIRGLILHISASLFIIGGYLIHYLHI